MRVITRQWEIRVRAPTGAACRSKSLGTRSEGDLDSGPAVGDEGTEEMGKRHKKGGKEKEEGRCGCEEEEEKKATTNGAALFAPNTRAATVALLGIHCPSAIPSLMHLHLGASTAVSCTPAPNSGARSMGKSRKTLRLTSSRLLCLRRVSWEWGLFVLMVGLWGWLSPPCGTGMRDMRGREKKSGTP
ncbi:hypothetical protein L202_02966 [Cryptococcus amylolentus CBS 6039]|uniref:Uncharacterized protein n=1 Tax=Cryptococcus amylolentus CBS 6039 TaxID=1295533 RepID=A0A1E3HYH4_9TREE|nr:hypothetical protein L202_02966 [Cryptococcus amylolentus CBS 6039]ODN80816.1 hypothetical protein L202_02966 [Cryptococcus amylolentus CBS 6039]